MALPNLSGSNIQDTFQRVLQTDNGRLRDGTGSLVSFSEIDTSIVNFPANDTTKIFVDGDNISFEVSGSDSFQVYNDHIYVNGDITASGISASSIVTPAWHGLVENGNGATPYNHGILRYQDYLNNGVQTKRFVSDEGLTFDGQLLNARMEVITLEALYGGITLSGSISLVGDITASGTIQAGDIVNLSNSTSGLRFNPTSTDVLSNLIVSGSTTASGDISSSGMIIGSNLTGSNTGDQDLSSYSTIVQLNASGSTLQTNIDAKAPIASPSFTGAITASGNISSSGTITANTIVIDEGGKFYLDGADPQGNPNTYIHNPGAGDRIEFYVDGGGGDGQKLSIGQSGTLFNNNTITIQGNITASGNISASGDLFFNNIDGGTF